LICKVNKNHGHEDVEQKPLKKPEKQDQKRPFIVSDFKKGEAKCCHVLKKKARSTPESQHYCGESKRTGCSSLSTLTKKMHYKCWE
jgi:hypothetical protein